MLSSNTQHFTAARIALLVIIIVLGIPANIIAIAVNARSFRKRPLNSLTYLHLAVVDLLLCSLHAPLSLLLECAALTGLSFDHKQLFRFLETEVNVRVYILATPLSALALGVIAVLRCWRVFNPFKQPRKNLLTGLILLVDFLVIASVLALPMPPRARKTEQIIINGKTTTMKDGIISDDINLPTDLRENIRISTDGRSGMSEFRNQVTTPQISLSGNRGTFEFQSDSSGMSDFQNETHHSSGVKNDANSTHVLWTRTTGPSDFNGMSETPEFKNVSGTSDFLDTTGMSKTQNDISGGSDCKSTVGLAVLQDTTNAPEIENNMECATETESISGRSEFLNETNPLRAGLVGNGIPGNLQFPREESVCTDIGSVSSNETLNLLQQNVSLNSTAESPNTSSKSAAFKASTFISFIVMAELAAVIISYIAICVRLARNVRSLAQNLNQKEVQVRPHIKHMITHFILILTFIATMWPSFRTSDGTLESDSFAFRRFCSTVSVFNSTVNPFIYCVLLRNNREKLCEWLCCEKRNSAHSAATSVTAVRST